MKDIANVLGDVMIPRLFAHMFGLAELCGRRCKGACFGEGKMKILVAENSLVSHDLR